MSGNYSERGKKISWGREGVWRMGKGVGVREPKKDCSGSCVVNIIIIL